VKTIAITGSSGFIGKKLANQINRQSFKLIKIGKRKRIEKIKYIKKFDVLVHLAFKIKIKNQKDNLDNILSILNLLNFCVKFNATMIFISTYSIKNYDKSKYILSKKHCEDLCNLYRNKFGLKIIILNTFNLYDYEITQNNILKQIINSYKKNFKLLLYKNFKRDYLHIDDFIDCIIKLLNKKNYKSLGSIEIGSGKNFSNLQILNIFKNNNVNLNNLSYLENKIYPYQTKANLKKIKSYINWSPKIDLETAIKKIININI